MIVERGRYTPESRSIQSRMPSRFGFLPLNRAARDGEQTGAPA